MTVDQVLSELDNVATEYDGYEFGLPLYNFKGETDKMRQIVIEFARFHVEAALKAASQKVKLEDNPYPNDKIIDKDSILDAYPLINIK